MRKVFALEFVSLVSLRVELILSELLEEIDEAGGGLRNEVRLLSVFGNRQSHQNLRNEPLKHFEALP